MSSDGDNSDLVKRIAEAVAAVLDEDGDPSFWLAEDGLAIECWLGMGTVGERRLLRRPLLDILDADLEFSLGKNSPEFKERREILRGHVKAIADLISQARDMADDKGKLK